MNNYFYGFYSGLRTGFYSSLAIQYSNRRGDSVSADIIQI